MQESVSSAWALLSEREREVIRLSAEGLTDAEVGIRLGIAAETVRSHWKRVRKRTGGLARAQILRLFGQTERNPYREIFDGLPVAAFSLAADGTVLDANPVAMQLIGSDRPRVVGGMFDRLFREPVKLPNPELDGDPSNLRRIARLADDRPVTVLFGPQPSNGRWTAMLTLG
jgi:DNA-binding CsgD family transcriptional regulator